MVMSFVQFLKKVLLGQYDEMTWGDINNLVILMALITGVFYLFL